MSKQVKIYGYSDDNIEIEAPGLREEYGLRRNSHLRFSDGTVIRCTFDEVEGWAWHFAVINKGEGLRAARHDRDEECEDMTLHLLIDAEWVSHDNTPDGPCREQLLNDLEQLDARDIAGSVTDFAGFYADMRKHGVRLGHFDHIKEDTPHAHD